MTSPHPAIPMTDRARRVVGRAEELALANGEPARAIDLLRALAGPNEGIADRVLEEFGLTKSGRIDELAAGLPADLRRVEPDPTLAELLAIAKEELAPLDHRYVGTEHLLLAIARCSSGQIAAVLASAGVAPSQLREQVYMILGHLLPSAGTDLVD